MVVGEIMVGTDLLVIGGGIGGYVAAIRASQLGKEVTLVEKAELGGICLNHGCIPSKALITAASLYHRMPRLAEMGISAKATIDAGKLQAWKEGISEKLSTGVGQLCKSNGVQVIPGSASFTSPKKVLVENEHGTQSIEFKQCIIATGSRSIQIPGFEFDGEVVLSSRHALKLKEVPEKLVVIGGGYIGLELGTVYAKLGSKVTVVEMMDQVLPGVDPELVRVVARHLKDLGIELFLRSKAKSLEKGKSGAKVVIETPEGQKSLDATKVLVSVGRRPSVDGLNIEQVKVELDAKGFIKVDAQRRTSNPKIFAVGDVAGQPMLAHKASHEAIVAANVIAGHPAGADWLTVPAVIFTDPEIASAGLTEAEAKAQGYEPLIGRFPFTALGRAMTTGETDGFVKMIADKKSEVVLGVHIVGPEASNLISEAALAIEMGARLEDIALTIHPHPTLPESLMEAAEVALGHAIHIMTPKKREPVKAS
ncbi:dihydrolipoyl dehydrogenase [Candidatus Acetothermia bacterium]|nr:dihydrolipoyl dehydrogenase [Candidatus Acetothermia bacterium]MBI3642562.1 dihydrolipoyl dehydrogenase [Candidatus Acetothermia bacterium]